MTTQLTEKNYVPSADAVSTATANKVVKRDANADVIVPTTPTAAGAAVSKTYAESLVPSTVSQPTRAIGTWYQNTSSKSIFVTISVSFTMQNNPAYYAWITGYINNSASTSGATDLGNVGGDPVTNTLLGTIYSSISFFVPAGKYYAVIKTNNGDDVTLTKWTEFS